MNPEPRNFSRNIGRRCMSWRIELAASGGLSHANVCGPGSSCAVSARMTAESIRSNTFVFDSEDEIVKHFQLPEHADVGDSSSPIKFGHNRYSALKVFYRDDLAAEVAKQLRVYVGDVVADFN